MSEFLDLDNRDKEIQNPDELLGPEALKLKAMRLAIQANKPELIEYLDSGRIIVVSKEEDSDIEKEKMTLKQIINAFGLNG